MVYLVSFSIIISFFRSLIWIKHRFKRNLVEDMRYPFLNNDDNTSPRSGKSSIAL